ncbi:MAG: ABC transporter substrate-binding protein [Actinobacteria bacterium]|nr:ABC transporter substrate-binding protein [Actinomycetota bacterium]
MGHRQDPGGGRQSSTRMTGRGRRLLLAAAAIATLSLVAAACGGSSPSGGGKASTKATVTLGTTDKIVSGDPAGAYDLPSWTWMYNVYQTLLAVPPGTTKIVPEAASCKWHGAATYVCTVKPGNHFSNGDPVTAADVAYSFQRVLKIKSPNGPSSLLAPMKSVTASGNTVTFKLTGPDSTWPYVLTTAAGSIVDKKVFPFSHLLPDSKIIGSGPYKLQSYTPDQLAVFVPNPHYGGTDTLHNGKFIVRYEQDASTLVSDVQSGAVDIGYRDLTPTQLVALSKSSGGHLEYGKGIEIRYLAFNQNVMPGANTAQKLAIRKAIAYLVNRQSITSNIYHGTVKPLYSLIPSALTGATTPYSSAYGSSPDVAKARSALTAAGVHTPVKFTLWYNVNHYQDTDLATELMRELNASHLFNVSLSTAEWSTYSTAALSNQYGAFLFGWFPDYPDADDYTSPFLLCKTNFLNNHFCNTALDKQITKEESTLTPSVRNAAFAKIQTLTAQMLPLIPIWQGGQVAAVRNGVTGVQSTLDPSYTFRFWLVGKS